MAMQARKAMVTQHVSIVKDWQQCPVVKCTKCCRWVRASEGQYHCPLCPVTVYPPSTKDRLLRHLQDHQRDSVSCGDWHLLQCRLKCGGNKKPHFHCLYCSETIVEREAVLSHISDCISSKQNGHTESSQVTADTKVKSLDIKKVTSSDLKTSDESAEKVEKSKTPASCESSEEDQGNNGPTKRSVFLSTDSPTDSPVKRRRGRPPSGNKVPGRRVGRPSKKLQETEEDSSTGIGEQLTDLLERMIKEDGQHGKEGEGESDREEVFPVLAGVVPEAVLAVLPGSLTVTLRTVAQHSTVSWCKVSSGYVMLGHWSNMMTARTHIQQMLSDARTTETEATIEISQQEESESIQGEPELAGAVIPIGNGDAPLSTDPEITDEGVKTEMTEESDNTGKDQNKSEDWVDTAVDEEITEVKKEPAGRGLAIRTRRGLHNRVLFKNPGQASHTCGDCGYQSTLEGIKKHRARRHSSVEHDCAVCGMKFGIRYDMRRHRMTHFDAAGNMLPDAVTLLKSFQPGSSPMLLSDVETSFVPEDLVGFRTVIKNESKKIQELLDFSNEKTAQALDEQVEDKGQPKEIDSSEKIGIPGALPLGCQWCSVQSFSVSDLHQHCNDHHLRWSLVCPVCDQLCTDEDALSAHCNEAHNGVDIQLNEDETISAECQLCQFRGNVFDMSSHMTESHAATIRCCLCDEPIIDEDDVRCHRDEHLAARTLSGSAAATLPGSALAEGKPRRGRKPVKKPLRLPRENLDFTCEVCGRKLVGRASYSVHMKTHRMKPLLQCDQCEFSCYKPGLYNQHYRRKHCDERHPCALCDVVCASDANLKFHMQSVHRQGPSSVCEQCGKVFSTRRFLAVHVRRVHKAEKRYFCNVCGKGFFERVRMNEHEEVHKEGAAREHLKNFTCSFCGKRFLRQAHMLQHENTHTGRKPYQCKVCGKAFCYNAEVRKHMAVHSDARPHRCSYCGKGFKFRYKLTYHMTLHTKDSKHRCNDCGKAFTVNTTLKKHRCKQRPNESSWSDDQSQHVLHMSDDQSQHVLHMSDDQSQHVLHIIVPDQQETDDVKTQLASLMSQDWASQMEVVADGVVECVTESGVDDGAVEDMIEGVAPDETVDGAGVVYMCGVCSMLFSDQDLVNEHMLEHGTTVEEMEQLEAVVLSPTEMQDVVSDTQTDVVLDAQTDVVEQMFVIANEPSIVSSQLLVGSSGDVQVGDGEMLVEVLAVPTGGDTDLETAATALTYLAQ